MKILGGTPAKSGAMVNEKTAMQNVAVFACIRILAETPASLPLFVYRRQRNGGRERAPEHPTYSVLHDMANPEMTAMTFRETVQGHAVGWGNGYAYIVRQDGWVTELWPLLPDKTRPARVNGQLVYNVLLPNGEQRILNPVDVLHVPGFGFDGLQGYNPIRLAREAIGLGMAAEEFGARFFGQGTNLGGVVEHPGKLGQQAHENLRTSLTQSYQGLGKSHLLLILEEGMKYQKFGVPPNEAQFLETRKFQVTDIARLFRVPPHMIADLDRSTYSNIEFQAIEFVVHTLRPWLVRWEQAINYKLFTPRERKKYYAEHLVDGLLRGDAKSRAEALATLRQNGIINADEWREIENMNPQEGEVGKQFWIMSNMIPVVSPAPESAEPGPDLPAGTRAIPERRDNSVNARVRLAKAYERLFEDAGRRIVRREKADIEKIGLKLLAENPERFDRWLDEFYEAAPEWIARTIMPVVLSYAEAVQALAAEDIDAAVGMTRELEEFASKYATAFSMRYTSSSAGQVRHVVDQAVRGGADPVDAVTQRITEWEERRPGKVAMNETVQENNAIAREVYKAAGASRIKWQNTGSATCPYCTELDGKVVPITRPFLDNDERLQAEETGSDGTRIRRPTHHPPVHQGCGCMIVPD
jgi:HK97 family phage portal protein